jgi:hypothetical protein
MAPHLLSLPSEIRNSIYEYALTQAEGLLYHKNSNDVGQLCTRGIEDMVNNDVSEADENSGMTEKESMGQTGSDDKGEDENEQDDTIACPESGVDTLDHGRNHELEEEAIEPEQVPANQLQFVCRKLRNETKGLGVRLNTIRFAAKTEGKALEQCLSFLHSLAPHHKKYIRALDIYSSTNESEITNAPELFMFCKEHPKSQVNFHFGFIEHFPYYFIRGAIVLGWIFGKECFLTTYASLPWKLRYRIELSMLHTNLPKRPFTTVPSNFHIFPSIKRFDERRFRSHMSLDARSRIRLMEQTLEITGDDFVAWAENWCQNGV